MKFEIRSVQNGAVLRVELDYPDAEVEEIVYLLKSSNARLKITK